MFDSLTVCIEKCFKILYLIFYSAWFDLNLWDNLGLQINDYLKKDEIKIKVAIEYVNYEEIWL